MRPAAVLATVPVRERGDAADDPAIWIHPTQPERSLVLGTDKRGGLHVYNMDGTERDVVADGARPNNVDVLYDYELGEENADLAVASCRAASHRGVMVWAIDPATGTLRDVTAGGIIPVFGGRQPYGLCVYRSPRTGKSYCFVTRSGGAVEQLELEHAGGGKVRGTRVRAFELGSTAEGCVADDELGHVYFAEENAGIWKFGAEPDGGDRGRLIARVGDNGLAADVEGLTLYCGTNGKGYLIASSQGNSSFKVYDREGDNRFLLTIDPRADGIDDVEDTDGIAVTSCPTSRQFPKGIFVAQDGHNSGKVQDFHFYRWDEIAGTRLLVDTGWSPRAAAR